MSQCHDIYDGAEGLPASRGTEGTGDGATAGRPLHDCRILSDRRGNVMIVWVAGSLDWAAVKRFSALLGSQREAPAVIVDLSEARLDAAGSGALVTAVEQAHERHQQLVLVVTDSTLHAVLITIGLNLVVPIVSSEADAVNWLELHGVATGSARTAATGAHVAHR